MKVAQKNIQNFFPIYNRIYRNGLEFKRTILNIEDNIKQAQEKLNILTASKRQLEEELAEKSNEIQLQLQMNNLTNTRDIINSFNSSNQDADKYNRLIGKE